MDEVGLVVKKIVGNALLRFEKLGGHDDRILLAQLVYVKTVNGLLPGVISTIFAHMSKNDDPTREDLKTHEPLH